MTHPSAPIERVLAIDPSTRGFGFVVMEGSERLVNWGIREVKGDKNRESLKRVAQMIERYQPDVVVVEDYKHESSCRSPRVRNLLKEILVCASRTGTRARRVSRSAVKRAISPDAASTKHQIAKEIANRFPELASRLPRSRKPWMSEDYWMNIFVSASLALTLVLLERLTSDIAQELREHEHS